MDEVRVWSAARSQTDIARDMHLKIDPTAQAGLLGYWDFNEPSGTIVYNRVSGAPTLTLTGSPPRLDVKQVTSVSGGDTVITFPRSYLPGVGGWTAPSGISNLRALVVAGGGGGNGRHGGGGGAGGFLEAANVGTSQSPQSIIVGAGGTGSSQAANQNDFSRLARKGGDSSAFGLTANGGGPGNGWGGTASSGFGSGGGASFNNPGAPGTEGQGNSGGRGAGGINDELYTGGGGGGAGQVGGNASSGVGGNGGSGKASSITGSSIVYAAGGGGGVGHDGISAGTGGSGIGGNGGKGAAGTNGAPGTGSGGGAGGQNDPAGVFAYAGGGGGSGVVIVRYTALEDKAWTASAQQDIYTSSTPIPTDTNAAFTAEAWIYPTTQTSTWRNVFGSGTASNNESQRFFVGLNNSNQMFLSVGGAVDTSFDTNIKFDEWTHIAIAVTGSTTPTIDVYVNGQLLRQFVNAAGRQTIGSYFTIGSNPVLNYNWTGELDQVKVWENYLNRDQVAESMHAYQRGTLTASSELRAHYDFNEYNSGALLNRTGNAAYNLSMSDTVDQDRFTSSRIVETGTAHSTQNYVKFNRSYLTANGGWTPTANITRFKALVVGGGGAGGWARNADRNSVV
jgi:hypothetical protein